MASISKSQSSPKPFDDEDKWDIVTDNDGTQTLPVLKPASPPTATPPPHVSFGIPPPPMGSRPPVTSQAPYVPGLNLMQPPTRSPFSMLPGDNALPYPSRQMVLEAQIMQIAEVDLGLLNAADILEKHLLDKKLVEGSYEIFVNTNMNSPGRVVQSPANRNYCYSTERQNSALIVRDMAYLMGLDRAVKILRHAHEDRSRKDVTYSPKVVQISPQTPFPSPQTLMGQPPLPLQMSINENQFRNVAKEIVKDTLKECKDDNSTLEEVQKEMIKLCRDVCRDACPGGSRHHALDRLYFHRRQLLSLAGSIGRWLRHHHSHPRRQ